MTGREDYPIPGRLIFDSDLSPTVKDTLFKLFALAWDRGRIDGRLTTPSMPIATLAETCEIDRRTLWRHLSLLEAAGEIVRHENNAGTSFELADVSMSRHRDTSSSLSTKEVTQEESLASEEKKKRLNVSKLRHDLLKQAGVGEPMRSRLVEDEELSTETIKTHLRAAEAAGEPLRFAIHRMRSHEPPPVICVECGKRDGEHDLDCKVQRKKYAEQLRDVGWTEDVDEEAAKRLQEIARDVGEYARKQREEEDKQLGFSLSPPQDIGKPPDWWGR